MLADTHKAPVTNGILVDTYISKPPATPSSANCLSLNHGLCFILLLAAVGCTAPPSGESESLLTGRNVLPSREIYIALNGPVNFERHVKPILATKCVVCHDRDAQPKGLHLDSYDSAVESGALGTFIEPGHPERSPLLTKINSAHSNIKTMPPVGERLTSEEIEILKRWIQQGAQWPVSG